ncbi:hypothetical protein IJI91_01990 [Candidatus Saccharibacteria bacterium]|nr:hypothetical protein [Candidatus Saccharibacteria bacterium]
MLKIFFVIALIVMAIYAVAVLRYKIRYCQMRKVATTDHAKRCLELSTEYNDVCDRGSNAVKMTKLFAFVSAALLVGMLSTTFSDGDNNGTGLFDNTKYAAAAHADGEEDTADDAAEIPDDVIFYNNKVQDKSDGKNLNFGPNAYKEAKRGYAARDLLLFRCERDPFLLAATEAWFDINLNTNFCGVFYEDGADWLQAINDYAEAMTYDPTLFHDNYEAFANFVMDNTSPSVKKIKGEVIDSMFMLPAQYTHSGVLPQIIVCATDHTKGHYLVLKVKVKGDTFKLRFRMECGFQPTNCADKLNTTAVTRHVALSSGGKSGGSNPGSGNGPNKPNKPTKPTKPHKDGDGCKDTQTWTPSGGQQSERTTTDPSGGGNGRDNASDPPSGDSTRVDQGSGGGQRTADPPKSDPVVDSGNGKVDDD